MGAVQAHSHDRCRRQHLPRGMRAEAADGLETDFEIFIRVRQMHRGRSLCQQCFRGRWATPFMSSYFQHVKSLSTIVYSDSWGERISTVDLGQPMHPPSAC